MNSPFSFLNLLFLDFTLLFSQSPFPWLHSSVFPIYCRWTSHSSYLNLLSLDFTLLFPQSPVPLSSLFSFLNLSLFQINYLSWHYNRQRWKTAGKHTCSGDRITLGIIEQLSTAIGLHIITMNFTWLIYFLVYIAENKSQELPGK
jgi:hypothetical protein